MKLLSRDAGLTVPQLLCLRAIGDVPPGVEPTVASVGQAVQLSSPTVSRILDRMEHAGYIVRQRHNDDRRKVRLSLTEIGRQRLEAVPPPLHDQFLSRLRNLDQSERLRLLHSLQRIVDLMEAADIDAAPLLSDGVDPAWDAKKAAPEHPS